MSLRFGVSRSHSNVALLDGVRELSQLLRTALEIEVKPVVLGDYEQLLKAITTGGIDFAWMPPLICARAKDSGAMLVAVNQRSGAVTYRSALLVRADAPYRTIADLVGARAAWTDPNSAGGCVLPRLYLRAHKVDLNVALASERFYGSAAISCGAVANNEADLCASFVTEAHANDPVRALGDVATVYSAAPWRFRILAITESIASDGIVVGSHVPKTTRLQIGAALLDLHVTPGGSQVLRHLMSSDRLVQPTEAVQRSIALMRHRMVL